MGLRGVTSEGIYSSLDLASLRMLPQLYSNLGLSFKMEHNTADSNGVFAGLNQLGSECATTLEFSYLAARVVKIESFTITLSLSFNLGFLDNLGISYLENSTLPSTLQCSTFNFRSTSSETSVTLENIHIRDGSYFHNTEANFLYSHSAIDYWAFTSTTQP